MKPRNRPFGHSGRLIVAAVTVILAATPVCGRALAADLPATPHGLWKFQRTADGKKTESTKCTVPTDDMKRMNAKLKKSGCRVSPVKKSGNVYTYTVDCSLKFPSGSTFNTRSSSVMTVVSESSYKIEIDVVTDRQSSKELLVAQRIGDCER